MTKQEALDLIKQNPGCKAILDNDSWEIEKPKPSDWDEMSEEEQEEWYEHATLIWSDNVDGCDYGAGLVEVLALEFDMTCEDI